MRTSVWLVRHGQTQANQAQRYQSWSDSPLTPYGQRQLALLAYRLRRLPFGVALVSPTERARATAAAVLAGRADVPLVEAAGWAETHHGRWEGLTYREVLARFPAEAEARFAGGSDGKAAGGESLREVAARVARAWDDVLRRYPGGRVLVATHATPIQLVLCSAFNVPPEQHWRWRIDLGSLTCLDVYPTATIVRMVNEVPRAPDEPHISSLQEPE
jgi:2,3-bisphosphoglycerate-dependent phosphoglycerate mutase/probable phosphoglycerate mutase